MPTPKRPSPERTPRLAPEVRRQQLLDAALEALEAEGFGAVTVEAVARRAGVTRPVVYDQFGDLDGLLIALFDREEERALGPLLEIVGGAPGDIDPDTFLVEGTHHFLVSVRRQPQTWRLVLAPPDGGSAEFQERVQRSRRTLAARFAELVAWGIERRGGPAGLDPALLGRLLVAAGEDAARLVVEHPRRYAPDRLADMARTLIGLVPRGGAVPAVTVPELPPAAQPDLPPAAPAAGEGARRRVPMAERREQLLAHALALLGEEGFDALTVEALARRAGVSRVVVYRSFGSLHVLLLTLLRREEAQLTAELDALVPAEPGDRTPLELLTDALAHFLGVVTADPLTWRVALLRAESAPKALQVLVGRRRAALAKQLRPVVAWGLGGLDAPVDDLDVDLLARLLLSAGEELGRIALTEPELPPTVLLERMAALVAVLPWR